MLNVFYSKFGNLSYYNTISNSNHCLLFIHGLSCSKEIFHHLINNFYGDFRILSIDLLGHGEMREYWYKSVMNLKVISPKECFEKHRKKIKLLIEEEDPGIQINYLKENFDDITLLFKNVGHAVFWDKPEEVKKIIYTFFTVIFYI